MLAQAGKLPDAIVACVKGGSNAIGLFYPFIKPCVVFPVTEAWLSGLQGRECEDLRCGGWRREGTRGQAQRHSHGGKAGYVSNAV
eukprot:3941485-Rhodomonas_salina.2